MNLVFSSFEYPRLTAIFRHREYSTVYTGGMTGTGGGGTPTRPRGARMLVRDLALKLNGVSGLG
jgi:hypothetical protein